MPGSPKQFQDSPGVAEDSFYMAPRWFQEVSKKTHFERVPFCDKIVTRTVYLTNRVFASTQVYYLTCTWCVCLRVAIYVCAKDGARL